MKNLRCLSTMLMCSILLTGCSIPKMPWQKSEQPIQTTEQVPVPVPQEPISEPVPQEPTNEDVNLSMNPNTLEVPAQDETPQEISFGSEVVPPDTPFVSSNNVSLDTSKTGTIIELNGLEIDVTWLGFTHESIEGGVLVHYGVDDMQLHIECLDKEYNLDEAVTSYSESYTNKNYTPNSGPVTLCGKEARMVTTIANIEDVTNTYTTVLFNHGGKFYHIEIEHPKSKDKEAVFAVLNKVSLIESTMSFGSSDSGSGAVKDKVELPYTVQQMNSKTYLEFPKLTFKEPQGAFRDDTFCQKESNHSNIIPMVAFGFEESKCELSYCIEEIGGVTGEQYIDAACKYVADENTLPKVIYSKVDTLTNTPYLLSYPVDENSMVQKFIYIHEGKAHIFTYRIFNGNFADADTIYSTLDSITLH